MVQAAQRQERYNQSAVGKAVAKSVRAAKPDQRYNDRQATGPTTQDWLNWFVWHVTNARLPRHSTLLVGWYTNTSSKICNALIRIPHDAWGCCQIVPESTGNFQKDTMSINSLVEGCVRHIDIILFYSFVWIPYRIYWSKTLYYSTLVGLLYYYYLTNQNNVCDTLVSSQPPFGWFRNHHSPENVFSILDGWTWWYFQFHGVTRVCIKFTVASTITLLQRLCSTGQRYGIQVEGNQA